MNQLDDNFEIDHMADLSGSDLDEDGLVMDQLATNPVLRLDAAGLDPAPPPYSKYLSSTPTLSRSFVSFSSDQPAEFSGSSTGLNVIEDPEQLRKSDGATATTTDGLHKRGPVVTGVLDRSPAIANRDSTSGGRNYLHGRESILQMDGTASATPDQLMKVRNHCHSGLDRKFDKHSMYRLMFACALTLVFLIGEFIGGYISHSLTIMSDASHMLSDFASFLISLAAMATARKQASKRFSFGFHRAEVLGALVSIVIIWVLTGVLVYMAIERTIHRNFTIEPNPMLITAVCGVVFNIVLGIALSGSGAHHGHSHSLPSFGGGGHGHSHGSGSHGHSHDNHHAGGSNDRLGDAISSVPGGSDESSDYQISPSANNSQNNLLTKQDSTSSGSVSPVLSRVAKARTRSISMQAYPMEDISRINKTRNINVRAAFIHVLGDLVQSIGVLVAAIIIKFKPEWKLADPICTFIFSVLVMLTTFNVIKDILHVLMEGVPSDCDYDQIKKDLELIPGVRQAHSLHLWSLTMDKAAMAAHLAIDNEQHDAIEIMNRSSKMIRHKYSVMFVTIQVEPYDGTIMDYCVHCAGP